MAITRRPVRPPTSALPIANQVALALNQMTPEQLGTIGPSPTPGDVIAATGQEPGSFGARPPTMRPLGEGKVLAPAGTPGPPGGSLIGAVRRGGGRVGESPKRPVAGPGESPKTRVRPSGDFMGVPGEVEIPALAGGEQGAETDLTPDEQLQVDWRAGNYTPDLYDRAIPGLDAQTGLDAINRTLALMGVDSVPLNATGLDVGTALALDVNRDGMIDASDQAAWQRAVDAGGGSDTGGVFNPADYPDLFGQQGGPGGGQEGSQEGGGESEQVMALTEQLAAQQEQMDKMNQMLFALLARGPDEDEYALPSTYSIGGGF